MRSRSINDIVKNNACISCYTCFKHCRTNSITILFDPSYGRPVPYVDASGCISCGTCLSVCPNAKVVAVK